jgi:DNA (cytosine-5)-methyltransferase 1
MDKKIQAIDLFCGAGGLTRGLLDAGISVLAGYDIDTACQFPYEKNNDGAEFIERSVDAIGVEDVKAILGETGIRLIAGCAPCQPFSKYRQGVDTRKDQKWGLLYQFERIVREVGPDLVTMENVPELARHAVFADFRESLEAMGYHVAADVVDCRKYGIPQYRKRMVLVASRLGPIEIPPATHSEDEYRSAHEVISHLPPIEAGHQHPDDPLHCSSRLSDLNMKRIRQSRPGGTWRDWDPDLVAACHRKSSGKTYASVYGRMRWEDPSPTMTTQCHGFGNGRFGHPEQNRAISLREAAIFQTFPPDYKFVPDGDRVQFTHVGRMIGNAVPVRLGEVIGQLLLKHVERYA